MNANTILRFLLVIALCSFFFSLFLPLLLLKAPPVPPMVALSTKEQAIILKHRKPDQIKLLLERYRTEHTLPVYFDRYFKTLNLNDLFEDYAYYHDKHRRDYCKLKKTADGKKPTYPSPGILVFRPWESSGLANVMIGLTSSFLLSLLSGRLFFINWQGHYYCNIHAKNLFTQPHPYFNWWYEDFITTDLIGRCQENYPSFKIPPIHDNSQREYYGNLEVTHRKRESDYMFELLKCLNVTEEFDRFGPLVEITSNQFFLSLFIQYNPYHDHLLNIMFKEQDMFGPLARFLFHPIPSIQEKIDKFIVNHNIYVSDQIKESERMYSSTKNLRNHNGDVIMYGIQIRRNENEKQIDWFRESHEPYFWDACKKELIDRHDIYFHGKPYRIMVISDNSTTIENARKVFGKDMVLHYDEQNLSFSRDSESIKNALIDAWLYSYSQGFIVSKHSTFGNLGHGRASIKPFIVYHQKEKCMWFKPATSEPEFHWYGRHRDINCRNVISRLKKERENEKKKN
ncbi:hypothetical protein ABK040_012724 [Willaertia magna]